MKPTDFFNSQIKKVSETNSEAALDEFLNSLSHPDLKDHVKKLAERHGKTLSAVQIKVYFSKTMFYDILARTKPSRRHQIIQIGLQCGATVEEMNALLKLAGHKELYPKLEGDAIVIFGIKTGRTFDEINELLIKKNCELQFSEWGDSHAQRR